MTASVVDVHCIAIRWPGPAVEHAAQAGSGELGSVAKKALKQTHAEWSAEETACGSVQLEQLEDTPVPSSEYVRRPAQAVQLAADCAEKVPAGHGKHELSGLL